MLVFLKLGGSLITDKTREKVFRAEVMKRLANEIRSALSVAGNLKLLIGHGSGSFGHIVAKKYDTVRGVTTPDEWRGYAQVANVASELNYHVVSALQDAGVPALRIQPSASLRTEDGFIQSMSISPIVNALAHGLVPVIHGDVAFDDVRGGTIVSTETLFLYLAHHMPVDLMLLLGEVEGVLDARSQVVPVISPATLAQYEAAIGGSHGVDVTGGMETKVRDMLDLVERFPHLAVRILGGHVPLALFDALQGKSSSGTLITGG